jgi:hypothetical protein
MTKASKKNKFTHLVMFISMISTERMSVWYLSNDEISEFQKWINAAIYQSLYVWYILIESASDILRRLDNFRFYHADHFPRQTGDFDLLWIISLIDRQYRYIQRQVLNFALGNIKSGIIITLRDHDCRTWMLITFEGIEDDLTCGIERDSASG